MTKIKSKATTARSRRTVKSPRSNLKPTTTVEKTPKCIPIENAGDDSNQPPLADNLATPSTVGNNTEVQEDVQNLDHISNKIENSIPSGSIGNNDDNDDDDEMSDGYSKKHNDAINNIMRTTKNMNNATCRSMLKLFCSTDYPVDQFKSLFLHAAVVSITEKLPIGKQREKLDIIKLREKHWLKKFSELREELTKLQAQVEENKKQSVIPPRKVIRVKTIGLQTDLTNIEKKSKHEQKIPQPPKNSTVQQTTNAASTSNMVIDLTNDNVVSSASTVVDLTSDTENDVNISKPSSSTFKPHTLKKVITYKNKRLIKTMPRKAKPVPAKPTNFTVETVFKNNNNGQFKNMLTSETPIVHPSPLPDFRSLLTDPKDRTLCPQAPVLTVLNCPNVTKISKELCFLMIEMATLELHKDIISYDLFLYINPPDNCDLASFENININIWQKISVIRSTGSSMVFPIYKMNLNTKYFYAVRARNKLNFVGPFSSIYGLMYKIA